ncbi:MAG: hypothetical protein Kow0077_27450 [Anaerolineae bacterium]
MNGSFGVIFRRTLYDHRRSMLWWSVGLGALAFYVTVVYPLISEFEQINELLQNPVFGAIFGNIAELDYTSPEGFLGIEFFSWAPLVLAVFAVIFGGNIVGGEEERGTLDILLSTPIPRWRVIVEKYLAFIVMLVVILAFTGLAIVVAVEITPDLEMDMFKIAQAMLNIMPVMLLITSLTLFLTTVVRTRGQAGGLAAAFLVASYFINSFADMTDVAVLRVLQHFSFYKYYGAFTVLRDGIHWGNFALLTGVAVALFGLALFFFERRDLSV